jgi:DNA-binding response OmpR family regulator
MSAVPNKRILIVDDDASIQRMLRVCLEGTGYAVQQAMDGARALESIHREAPDLVLLDLAMPVLDGMTVLADLRSMLPDGHVKVVVMTAHGSVRSAMQAVRLGASDFLEKPFRPDELRQSIASVLDERPPAAGEGYAAALQSVREALRRGKFIAAEAALMKAGTISDDTDPRFLNLAGVLHEAHGRAASARAFYRKALAADPAYEPARFNLQRLDEFERSGSTRLDVALGDEPVPSGDPRGHPSAAAAERFRQVLHGPATGLRQSI